MFIAVLVVNERENLCLTIYHEGDWYLIPAAAAAAAAAVAVVVVVTVEAFQIWIWLLIKQLIRIKYLEIFTAVVNDLCLTIQLYIGL